jgi:anthranilate synthase component 1
MYSPTLNEAAALSSAYSFIPISKTMYADIKTPIEVLKTLKSSSSHCYMLESLEGANKQGRYTFLGYDPLLEFTCTNGSVRINAQIDINVDTSEPIRCIQQILDQYKSPRFNDLPSFTGGLVGYFSYDFIKYSEPSLKLNANDDENFKDVDLMLFDKVIAFDHFKQQIILIVNISTDELKKNYEQALKELDHMTQLIKNGIDYNDQPLTITSEFFPLFNKKSYCDMVEQAKKYIYEGDIFQVVLSNRLEAEAQGSLLDTYRVLRTTNPSPYMFYFSGSDIEVAGASPETLVKLKDDTLYTFPLAGTRPRGESDDEDLRLEKELLSDPKELAEHNMLVDLGRNDIGKISKFGSVCVEKYLSVERFSRVMHIGSTVHGILREDKTALDAVAAILPAGTLSGAPKLRACQIIDELENNKRGIYGGAIGYIDFTGNMDTCIAIRIAYKKDGRLFVRSGAGIVADSVPEKEYQECIDKAYAVVNALKISQGGIDE